MNKDNGRSPLRGSGHQPTASAPSGASQSGVPNAWLPFFHSARYFSERGAGFIEGFASACASLSRALCGEPDSGKSYDPMTVDLRKGTMFSYVFDMKDGSRQHPLADYQGLQEVADCLLRETIATLQDSDLSAEDLLGLINRAASGIEAATADETALAGSAEGEDQ
jgi:hypothetical protein